MATEGVSCFFFRKNPYYPNQENNLRLFTHPLSSPLSNKLPFT
jgi:hypothetical protein